VRSPTLTFTLNLNPTSVSPLLTPPDHLLLISTRPSKNTVRLLRRQDCRSYISCPPSVPASVNRDHNNNDGTSESIRFVQTFSYPPIPYLVYCTTYAIIYCTNPDTVARLFPMMIEGWRQKYCSGYYRRHSSLRTSTILQFSTNLLYPSAFLSGHCLSPVFPFVSPSNLYREACQNRHWLCSRSKIGIFADISKTEQNLNIIRPAFIAAWSVRSESDYRCLSTVHLLRHRG
jgi:hypothetical protein